MTNRDQQIGRAVARLRGGRSQQWLADEMRTRGWKWAQATVWNIEKGERPLRLAEAQDLAAVFGVSLNTLIATEPELDMAEAIRRTADAYGGMRAAVRDFVGQQISLALASSTAAKLDVDIDYDAVDGWLDETPESVCKEEASRVIELADASGDPVRESLRSGQPFMERLKRSYGKYQEEG